MLKDSIIRSLFRDSDKLIKSQDEQYIGKMKRDIEKMRQSLDKEHRRYQNLYRAVEDKFGVDKACELVNR